MEERDTYATTPSHQPARLRVFLYLATTVILTAVALRLFVFDSFVVAGNSMAPELVAGDYVLVNRMAYVRNEPQRDDVVVGYFRDVRDTRMVKRVLGVPREWIDIAGNTASIRQSRDGEVIAAATLYAEHLSEHMPEDALVYRLDPHEYFLVGDNGAQSIDSRHLGPADIYDIGGRVFLRFRPSEFSFESL